MENGAFSEKEFAQFGEEVILFCHITTKLTGDPDQSLLGQKSARVAFPTLLFLDPQGEVLARQGERSVTAFRKSVQALELIQRLQVDAAKGDEAAKAAVFLAQLDLGNFNFNTAQAASASLKLDAQQQQTLAIALVNLEVDHLYAEARKDRSYADLAPKFLAMRKAGRVPTARTTRLRFWTQIMNSAQQSRDAKLYEEAMTAYQAATANSRTFQLIRDRQAKVLAALKSGREIPARAARRVLRKPPIGAKQKAGKKL